MQQPDATKPWLPWFMWFFPLTFFGFQFILRLFPGLIMPEMMAKYGVTATDFGLFASIYYVGYSSMQIPMAILLDKWGPRYVISASALLCGLSCWILVFFDSWYWALASRLFIGIGSVVGFLGTSKVISTWFPLSKYAKLVGLTFSFGLLGALYGGRPISILIEEMTWEHVLEILGAASIAIGLLVLIFVKNKPQSSKEERIPIKTAFKSLCTNKSLLLLAVGNLLMVGALEGFADVWGVPYLMAAQSLSKVSAASIVSFIFMGMLVGGPLLAWLSDRCGSYYVVTVASGLLMAIGLAAFILFNQQLNFVALCAIMFAIGAMCCYQVLIFAIGTNLVVPALQNMTIAFLNCINMMGGIFFHSIIGRSMDWFEGVGNLSNTYSVSTFTYALMLIPMASIVGAGLIGLSGRQANKPL